MIKQHPWQGVLWKLCACGCFAAVNGIVRYLSGGGPDPITQPLHSYMIVLLQNICALIFVVPWLLASHKPSFTTENLKLHALRVALAVCGVCLWYLALQYIQIATSIALGFMGPIITVIGATWLLHERLTKPRITAILISFIGACFILRPDKILLEPSSYDFAVLLPIAATMAFAGSKLITRKLAANGVSAQVLTIYLLIFMTPISLIPALLHWQMPTIEHLPYLLGLGLLVATAHIAFSKAYAIAEVTFLMPFGFSKFIFSIIVGYLWFNELPHEWGIYAGMITIFISTLVIGYLDSIKSNPNKDKENYKA
ncbi:MAG: hypothetical protein COC15_01065 [Legionellales bacterium]|nr:MAG: hypothetical protein COC15_01065 [Legionellales bacterium]